MKIRQIRTSPVPVLTTLASIALALGAPGSASGDTFIRDDVASAEYLASQISMSSGAPTDRYSKYSAKLAKTLSLLTPEQQVRVFGTVHSTGVVGGAGKGGGAGVEGSLSEEEIDNMEAFEEFLTGESSEPSWDGNSRPWWWGLFESMYQQWLQGRI